MWPCVTTYDARAHVPGKDHPSAASSRHFDVRAAEEGGGVRERASQQLQEFGKFVIPVFAGRLRTMSMS